MVLSTIFFVVWVLFFDRNNYLDLQDVEHKIEALEREYDYCQKQIEADSAVIQGLKDSVYLERYAREHFFMKRPGETMYLVDFKD